MLKNKLITLASQFSLSVVFERPQLNLVRFIRDDVTIDVWRSGTVGIYRFDKDEKRYIKNVKDDDLAEIFANPDINL